MKFLTPLDLSGNELRNARVQNLAVAPSSPTTGQMYYDTALGKARVWDGSAWQSARAADFADRSTHTGFQTASTISDFATTVRSNRLDQLAAPTGSVSFGSQRITSLADPSSAQDAATKAYVDSLVQGLDVKASVRVATTANVALTGTQTIDGVAVIAGDRVLVKNQTTTSENGIYVVAAGAWSRATDMVQGTFSAGAFAFAEAGTTQANTGWVLGGGPAYTVGTTAMPWSQFSGGASLIAGAGLTQTGNTFDVIGTANRISVAADSIDISVSYVGQTSITTLGTVTTGTWTGTAIGLAYGGTGATTAAGARTAIGAVGKYTTLLPAQTTPTVTHNLGTSDVVVSVVEVATGIQVTVDVTVVDGNNLTIGFAVAPSANAYRVAVIG